MLDALCLEVMRNSYSGQVSQYLKTVTPTKQSRLKNGNLLFSNHMFGGRSLITFAF